MSKTIQPRLGTVITMIVAVLFLFLLFSQAGKYHQAGFIVEKAEERIALNQERKKALLYIGVNDEVALKLEPVRLPQTTKKNTMKPTLANNMNKTDDPNIPAAMAIAQTRTTVDTSVKSQNIKIKRYTVRQGDTLFGIAQKVYGDGNKWRIILQNNKTLVKPSQLRSGMKLTIPEPTENNAVYLRWIKTNKQQS